MPLRRGTSRPNRRRRRAAHAVDRALPRKYRSISPDVSADFLRQNLIVEFQPERAFAIIEREEEFSTRATRWVF